MTRLSEIPEETLKEIQDFVKRNKGVIPVTTTPTEDGTKIETLPEAVEKKFGYKLSPSQIYDLQRGTKTYKVKVDMETVRELERTYGNVGAGIKKVLKFYKTSMLPEHLRKPHEALVSKEKLTASELEEVLAPFVKESREAWKIVGELSRLGFMRRDKEGNYIFSRFRRDPFLEFLLK